MNKGTEKLVAVVTARDLSEREAAKLVPCSPSAMHKYLAGAIPSGDTLFKLCAAFKIKPTDFYEPKEADVDPSKKAG